MHHTLPELLARSSASDEFKADVRAFVAHDPAPRLTAARHSPRVKVLRVVAQLLDTEPQLRVERVHVDASSGCADFRGVATVETDDGIRTFDFVWDCHWRAVQQGWKDCFGLPDQIRAAREFGYQCFQRWSERAPEAERGTPPASPALRAG